jgi:hypothetical protein
LVPSFFPPPQGINGGFSGSPWSTTGSSSH